jgi:hypothetical protein
MKIIKLHVLGLLFVGSFNVLGTECKIKNKDLIYEVTSSVYSYSNDTKTGTCKCKAGYEFKINPPLPMGRLSVAGKDNLFTEPSGLAKEEKELQCVIPKDDTELSTAEWAVPISIFSAMAISPIGYSIFKRLNSSANTPNTNTDTDTDTIEMSESGYLTPSEVRNLLPANQVQAVEEHIYFEINESGIASHENTYVNYSRNPYENFKIGENTYVNSNVSENTSANGENIYSNIDEIHEPLNGGATGGPRALPSIPSTTADTGTRTGSPAPEREYDEISSNICNKCKCNIS